MFLAIPFPPLDPVAVEIGPLVIRWYALAYLAGFVLGWRYCMRLAVLRGHGPTSKDYDDYLIWAVIGVVLGGRIGYVLFYQLGYYADHPLEAFQVWHGGMSFHGGLLGVLLAMWIFTKVRKLSFLAFADLIACATPIGLFFGRIANFINGELFGRVTDVPWGVVFPRGGDLPRHPSQIYEAGLEGLVLFLILFAFVRMPSMRDRTGMLSGVFLAGYGAFRFFAEYFREPDAQIGYLPGQITAGQLFCIPMIAIGIALIIYSVRKISTHGSR